MNVGNVGSVQSATQEALETAAQTKAEAAKGDQQALRKLASQQAAAANAQSAQKSSEGAENGLDVEA